MNDIPLMPPQRNKTLVGYCVVLEQPGSLGIALSITSAAKMHQVISTRICKLPKPGDSCSIL